MLGVCTALRILVRAARLERALTGSEPVFLPLKDIRTEIQVVPTEAMGSFSLKVASSRFLEVPDRRQEIGWGAWTRTTIS